MLKTIALRLDPDTRFKLEQLANATGRTRSSLVAEAVQKFVDSEIEHLIALGKGESLTESSGKTAEEPEDEKQVNELRWNLIV